MKVFACKRQMSYSGGLILVAAPTKEEAFMTAVKSPLNYLFKMFGKDGYYVSDPEEAETITTDYYPLEDWYEIENLTAQVSKPQVIEEDGYTE